MTVTAPRRASSAARRQPAPDARPQDAGRGTTTADLMAAVACTAAGPAFLALAGVLSGPTAATAAARLEQLLAVGCATVGLLLCAAWAVAVLSTLLWALAARRGSPRADLFARCSPALLRRLAAAAFGLHVVLAPGAAAQEAPTAAWLPSTPSVSQTAADDGPRAHWLPGAPAPTGPGLAAPRRPDASAPTVTVVDGDCLWDLAAAELGPDATVLEVDARWREWHRHNRDLIGEDPHVLYTGTVLEIPPHTGRLSEEEPR